MFVRFVVLNEMKSYVCWNFCYLDNNELFIIFLLLLYNTKSQ